MFVLCGIPGGLADAEAPPMNPVVQQIDQHWEYNVRGVKNVRKAKIREGYAVQVQ